MFLNVINVVPPLFPSLHSQLFAVEINFCFLSLPSVFCRRLSLVKTRVSHCVWVSEMTWMEAKFVWSFQQTTTAKASKFRLFRWNFCNKLRRKVAFQVKHLSPGFKLTTQVEFPSVLKIEVMFWDNKKGGSGQTSSSLFACQKAKSTAPGSHHRSAVNPLFIDITYKKS